MHISIPLKNTCEFVNITSINPLISKCQVKVCYVDDEPNRNGTVINKETALKMAQTLPGCPIVGFYNTKTQDFEEHNQRLNITEDGELELQDNTFPYGFIDVNPKVWFQKFIDDGKVEREYLMTEGYIWSDIYPESKRITEKGNNQSMELNEETLNGNWAKDEKGIPQFFIINDAIIEKLCVLGEQVEPCFEGAQIRTSFSLSDSFKEKITYMANEVKNILNNKGGANLMNFAVEIGNSLWNSTYSFLEQQSTDGSCNYNIIGFYQNEDAKYAVVKDKKDEKNKKLNFSINENGEGINYSFDEAQYEGEVTPQFSAEDIQNFEEKRYASSKNDGQNKTKKPDENSNNNDKGSSNENKTTDDAKKKKEENGDYQKKNKSSCGYSLNEIPEYVELLTKFSALEKSFETLQGEYTNLKEDLVSLSNFKKNVDRKEKQDMINSFYMLSDEDKKDVVTNIDTYSLDEIESKLSVICVRNKVSFSKEEPGVSTTFNLNEGQQGIDSDAPGWLKSVDEYRKKQ